MAENRDNIESHKAAIRERVWKELREVALPDSKFHYDFSSFIPDFKDSSGAIVQVQQLEEYKKASCIFITPDNCLRGLCEMALRHEKQLIVSTFGIRRGFYLLDPHYQIQREDYKYASTLEGMEDLGSPYSLKQLRDYPSTNRKPVQKIDLMVTGTGAVAISGVRFGKGHGFFDLEWGMLYSIGCVNLDTPVVTVAHDYQVVEDMGLRPDVFDTVSDYIATPTRMIRIQNPIKPTVGILWDKLQDGMLEDILPLKELRDWQLSGVFSK